jgi:hypothetical protein
LTLFEADLERLLLLSKKDFISLTEMCIIYRPPNFIPPPKSKQ